MNLIRLVLGGDWDEMLLQSNLKRRRIRWISRESSSSHIPSIPRICLFPALWFVSVSYAVSIGGSTTWDGIKKNVDSPGSASKGTVEARADVWLSEVDGEQTHWYSKSGEWAYQTKWRYNLNDPPIHNTLVESAKKIRNYHYFDCHYQKMMWNEDNEIWKPDPDNYRHSYGSRR